MEGWEEWEVELILHKSFQCFLEEEADLPLIKVSLEDSVKVKVNLEVVDSPLDSVKVALEM